MGRMEEWEGKPKGYKISYCGDNAIKMTMVMVVQLWISAVYFKWVIDILMKLVCIISQLLYEGPAYNQPVC